jgi:hypothetical protein
MTYLFELFNSWGGEIAKMGLPALAGYYARSIVDKKSSKKAHDINIFKTLDAIANEECITDLYNSSTGAYWIGNVRFKISAMLDESEKSSNTFLDKKSNELLYKFNIAARELFLFYSGEGLPCHSDADKQTVYFKHMDQNFSKINKLVEAEKFTKEIAPKIKRLSGYFRDSYLKYRKHIKYKYYI